jgi:hypothetical protein
MNDILSEAIRQGLTRPVVLLNPEDLRPEEWLRPRLRNVQNIDAARYLVHAILTRPVEDRDERDRREGGVPLMSKILKGMMGSEADRIKEDLLAAGVIVRDDAYSAGVRSKAFGLGPSLNPAARLIWVEPTHETLVDKLRGHRVEKYARCERVHADLIERLARVELDSDALERDVHRLLSPGADPEGFEKSRPGRRRRLVLASLAHLNREDRHDARFFMLDRYGRFHSVATNMLGGQRGYLYGPDGRPLVNIDLANSQPLVLGLVLLRLYPRRLPDSVRRYIELCESGRFYEELMREAGFNGDRDCFKPKVFTAVFFGEAHKMRGPIADAFRRMFPEPWEAILELKRENYRNAAWQMQRAESDLVLKRAARAFMRRHPDAPLLTVHDSIMTAEDYRGEAEAAIMAAFRREGLRPTIKAKPTSRDIGQYRETDCEKAGKATRAA